LGYGVFRQTLTPSRAAYLIMLVAVFTTSFVLFIRSMEKENRLAIESNWGGLGGGLGGWRVSSTLTFLLTSVALFALLVTAISADPPSPDLLERYRAAINVAEHEGIRFQSQNVVGRKLYLKGATPSLTASNDFWNQVKLVHPLFDDIVVDLSGDGASSGETSPSKPEPANRAQPNVSQPAPAGGAGAPTTKPAGSPGVPAPTGARPTTLRPSGSSPSK
jgi:hypothetical protein